LLILDSYKNYYSDKFEEYCKKHNIVTLCIPAYSFYILQLLDVGCFGLLKKVYSQQIEDIIQAYIIHITKNNFLPAFYIAYFAAITKNNIQEGFRGTGLLLFDPEKVISILDLKLYIPTPENSCSGTA